MLLCLIDIKLVHLCIFILFSRGMGNSDRHVVLTRREGEEIGVERTACGASSFFAHSVFFLFLYIETVDNVGRPD